jgi:hypothetical protein
MIAERSTLNYILSIIDNKGIKEEAEIKSCLKTLLDMKDRSVTVNKCAKLLFDMFDDNENLKKLSYDQLLPIVMSSIQFLYIYGLKPIERAFRRANPSLKSLLKSVYLKTETRSNWGYLFNFYPKLVPNEIIKNLSTYNSENFGKKIKRTFEEKRVSI